MIVVFVVNFMLHVSLTLGEKPLLQYHCQNHRPHLHNTVLVRSDSQIIQRCAVLHDTDGCLMICKFNVVCARAAC